MFDDTPETHTAPAPQDTPPTLPAQFLAALNANDVEASTRLWQDHPDQQGELLAEALINGQALAQLSQHHTLPSHWPSLLLTNDRTARIPGAQDTLDWMKVAGTWNEAFARQQLDGLEPILARIENVPGKTRDYARLLFASFPGVVHDWFEANQQRAGLLAGLAIGRPQERWLVESKIELTQFLGLVLAHDDLSRVLGSGQGEAAQAWNAWMKGTPELTEAWEHLREDDTELAQQYADWVERWLPDGLWGDSPLQVWLDGEDVEEGRPLDDVPFPEDAEDLTDTQQREILRKHFPKDTFEALEGAEMAKRARMTLGLLIQDTWPQDFWLVLGKRPASLAIEALARKKDWGWTGASTKQSAADLQGALNDPRLMSVLRKMGENSIVRVLDTDPKPEHWVDEAGRHLLDLWLTAQGNKAKLRGYLVEKLGETHLRFMTDQEDALTGGRKHSKFDYMGWQAAKTRLPALAKQVKAAVGAKISQKIRDERRQKRANAPVDRTPAFVEPEQERARGAADMSKISVSVRKRRSVENSTPQDGVDTTPVNDDAGGERAVLRIRR